MGLLIIAHENGQKVRIINNFVDFLFSVIIREKRKPFNNVIRGANNNLIAGQNHIANNSTSFIVLENTCVLCVQYIHFLALSINF